MTYQDALDLEEAGFPQEGMTENLMCYHDKFNLYCFEEECKTVVYVPTLEELIEACGIHFFSLTSNLESKWTALHENGKEYIGSSPIQAVKNLYCALNKK